MESVRGSEVDHLADQLVLRTPHHVPMSDGHILLDLAIYPRVQLERMVEIYLL